MNSLHTSNGRSCGVAKHTPAMRESGIMNQPLNRAAPLNTAAHMFVANA
jgi:hypothetical protein